MKQRFADQQNFQLQLFLNCTITNSRFILWTYSQRHCYSTINQGKNFLQERLKDPPFERSACFYVTVSESFKRFQYFNFETNFLENENLFQKTGVPFFS